LKEKNKTDLVCGSCVIALQLNTDRARGASRNNATLV